MTQSLAVELAPDAIRVCGLAPVIGTTALPETFFGRPDTPENRERFIATIPLGRLCEPKDVASAALFLASEEAEFPTGVILEIDGGRTIRAGRVTPAGRRVDNGAEPRARPDPAPGSGLRARRVERRELACNDIA